MTQPNPPAIPTWMLEHCTAAGCDASLSGDLLEEFRNGRSAAWYWRQVLAAIAISCWRDVRNHRNAVVFAVILSQLAPAWLTLATGVTERAADAGHIWRLDWPWSALCSSALSSAPGLIFLLAGTALYIAPQLRRSRHISILRLARGLCLGAVVFMAVSAGLVWLTMLFPAAGPAIDQRGPALSIAPTAPLITPRNLGGGTDVAATRNKQRGTSIQVSTHVYVVQNSPWPSQAFRLDHNASAQPPITPLAAIVESGAWPMFTRLTFFVTFLFALWPATPRSGNRRKRTAA
jgi:hypothetical protein